jgi:ribosomal protein L2
MKIKKYNPTSPGLRHRLINQKNLLALDSLLIKNLSKFLKRSYGRSSQTGRITS